MKFFYDGAATIYKLNNFEYAGDDLNNFFITHYNISHINKKGLIFITIKYFSIYMLRQAFFLNPYIIVAPPVSFEYT